MEQNFGMGRFFARPHCLFANGRTHFEFLGCGRIYFHLHKTNGRSPAGSSALSNDGRIFFHFRQRSATYCADGQHDFGLCQRLHDFVHVLVLDLVGCQNCRPFGIAFVFNKYGDFGKRVRGFAFFCVHRQFLVQRR